ncbi:hypothetical protein EVAR_7923_1 [Eumeta japonica]|uniref:Uncharacterized protein n=1 Tax=Eumeta variegata TaxID=151549 RepID=A0A4C1TVA1_EUMVA|nr:hypothetical protein EVAR_7923_1 [Eumeta japonica]
MYSWFLQSSRLQVRVLCARVLPHTAPGVRDVYGKRKSYHDAISKSTARNATCYKSCVRPAKGAFFGRSVEKMYFLGASVLWLLVSGACSADASYRSDRRVDFFFCCFRFTSS